MRSDRRRTMARWGRVVAAHAALILLAGVFMLPIAWMVSTSLKPDDALFTERIVWIPPRIAWENYQTALTTFPFWLYLRNTLVIAILTMAGTVLSCLPPAYAFARMRWRGRRFWFWVMLSTLMLPPQVTILPVFLLFRWLGWVDTFLPLIVPAFLGNAFFIFMLRQFFITLPQEVVDAARIDGCSDWLILWRIVAPMSKPAIATVALFAFVWSWTDFMGPLIYLNDASKFTLAVGLQYFLGRHGEQWNLLMAAAVVVTAPLVGVFLLAQRAFVRGITLTGLKG
ncbi:MAG: carbohydrate ABC transporter permease [Armatimonadetes bacterium]|nr:carbohydrate ABC transporter permease [Armatimonadota bacterium]